MVWSLVHSRGSGRKIHIPRWLAGMCFVVGVGAQIAFLHHPYRHLSSILKYENSFIRCLASLFSFFRKEMFIVSLSSESPVAGRWFSLHMSSVRTSVISMSTFVLWIFYFALCSEFLVFRFEYIQLFIFRCIRTCYSNVTKWCRVVGDVSASDRAQFHVDNRLERYWLSSWHLWSRGNLVRSMMLFVIEHLCWIVPQIIVDTPLVIASVELGLRTSNGRKNDE